MIKHERIKMKSNVNSYNGQRIKHKTTYIYNSVYLYITNYSVHDSFCAAVNNCVLRDRLIVTYMMDQTLHLLIQG